MKHLIVLGLLVSSQAFASATVEATAYFPKYISNSSEESPLLGTVLSTFFPTASIELTMNHDMLGKLIAAQEDAAFFVGTEGKVKTAALDAAIKVIRGIETETQATDLQISYFILSLK